MTGKLSFLQVFRGQLNHGLVQTLQSLGIGTFVDGDALQVEVVEHMTSRIAYPLNVIEIMNHGWLRIGL